MADQKHYAYFSAAIRDGAKLRPQGFGSLYKDNRSCALGAGYEVVAANMVAPHAADYVMSLFPYLVGHTSDCPVAGCQSLPHADDPDAPPEVADVIAHLNDVHQWEREKIADWLYTEEEKLGFITLSEEASPVLSLEIQDAESQVSLVRH